MLDRLNLTSTEATSRIGRAINRVYRAVTTSIGMQLSRNTTASASTSINSAQVTFTSVEKIDRLYKIASSGAIVELKEVLLGELRGILLPSGDNPSRYAILSHTAEGITVQLDATAATVYTVNADVQGAIADLSGTNEPAFPESFHDILVEGTLAQEYRKVERQAFAKEAEFLYQQRLSDLRMWIAKSYLLDIKQGGSSRNTQQSAFNGGGGAGGGSLGSTAQTITALWTFDRDPSAPFAVTSGSAVVTNLDADKLDGLDSTAFAQTANPLSQFAATTSAQLAGVISDETGSGSLVFATAPALLSPVLTTPVLGTPSSGIITNCTGSPTFTALTLSTALTTANGGTGLSSPSTSGNILTSNGSIWTSVAPAVSVSAAQSIYFGRHFGGF